VDNSDILIAAFWTRLGTPTTNAESGTAEEIKRFISAGKKALLYFSSAPIIAKNLDQIEYNRLLAFQDWCRANGLLCEYKSTADLRRKLPGHISRTLNSLHTNTDAATTTPEVMQRHHDHTVATPGNSDQLTEPSLSVQGSKWPKAQTNITPSLYATLRDLELRAVEMYDVLASSGYITHNSHLDLISKLTSIMKLHELCGDYSAIKQLILDFVKAGKEVLEERSRADYFSIPAPQKEEYSIDEFVRLFGMLNNAIRSLTG
jgi:hypothetical protein